MVVSKWDDLITGSTDTGRTFKDKQALKLLVDSRQNVASVEQSSIIIIKDVPR